MEKMTSPEMRPNSLQPHNETSRTNSQHNSSVRSPPPCLSGGCRRPRGCSIYPVWIKEENKSLVILVLLGTSPPRGQWEGARISAGGLYLSSQFRAGLMAADPNCPPGRSQARHRTPPLQIIGSFGNPSRHWNQSSCDSCQPGQETPPHDTRTCTGWDCVSVQ